MKGLLLALLLAGCTVYRPTVTVGGVQDLGVQDAAGVEAGPPPRDLALGDRNVHRLPDLSTDDMDEPAWPTCASVPGPLLICTDGSGREEQVFIGPPADVGLLCMGCPSIPGGACTFAWGQGLAACVPHCTFYCK